MTQRKHWIDMLRGVCEMVILLDHSEVYYTGSRITNYNMYSANALVLFFFLSGYLSYKQAGFDISKKLKALLRAIVVPYFIFTTILSLPKALAHGTEYNIIDTIVYILGGQASWFVAALCVAEFIFFIAIWLSKGSTRILGTVAVAGFGSSILLSYIDHPNIWQIENGLQGLLFLFMGYCFHKYEYVFSKVNKPSYTITLLILLAISKLYIYTEGVNMMICPIRINNYPVFLIDITIFTLLSVNIFKNLPPCKWIEWTGSHTIVYYFFCGAVPMAISMVFNKIGIRYSGNYIHILAVFLCVYAMTTAIAWLVYTYIPCIVGKKKQ